MTFYFRLRSVPASAGEQQLMDNKRLIVVIALTTLLMMLWMFGMPWFARQLGYDLTARQATTQPAAVAPAPVDPLAEQPTTSTAAPGATTQPAQGTALRVLTSAERRTVTLGSAEPEDEQFALELTLNSVGAGIEEVVLNRYRQAVEGGDLFRFQQPYPDQPDATRPLATYSVELLGQRIDLSRVPWAINADESNAEQVTFYVEIGSDAGPVARINKVIKIYPRQAENGPDPRGGYEVLVRQTIDNLTESALGVQMAFNGPTTPPRELEYGYDRMVIAGYRGRNGRVDYKGWTVEEFSEDEPKRDLINPEVPPLLWAGSSSIYFNAIVRPHPLEVEEGDVAYPRYIRQVVAGALNPKDEDD